MRQFKAIILFIGVMAFSSFFEGCSGAGTGTGAALEIADQMSLVTSQDSNLSSLSTFGALTPTAGDFLTDQAEIWVFDEASEDALRLINEILCMVGQTAYGEMVNQGNYIAMIDISLCEGRREDRSTEGSNQSSGQEKEFESWIVNSSRQNDSSPQIVRFWIQGAGGDSGEDPFNEIRAHIEITEAKSDANPYGVFTMYFRGLMDGTPTMEGVLASSNANGLVDFQMVIDGGDFFQEQTHAQISPDGTTGQAFVNHTDDFGEESIDVAFDTDFYLADFADKTVCLDRNDFRENVWAYNLYDAAGARLERSSGMPIRIGSSERDYGWADYYGVWVPQHLEGLSAGDEVTNEDGTETYTIFQGGGRLIRRTRQEFTLADFVNSIFNYWDHDDFTNYLIRVEDGGGGTINLVKFATESCGEDGCSQEEIPEENITLTPNRFFSIWKHGVGNVDIIVPGSGTLSSSTVVPMYVEEFVAPSDPVFDSGDLELQCYSMCLKAPLSAALFNSGDVFEETINDGNTPPYTYTISADDMTLKSDGVDIALAAGTELNPSSPNFWGVRSGSMVPADVTIDNPWEVYSEEVQYNYEAGPNPWNRMTTLLDSNGDAVEFDAPLSCIYQDDENGTFNLQYHGLGRLHGIPFEKVESDDGDFDIWVAEFTIPDGTELNCDGTPYYTKAMAIEQTMEEVDEADCAHLSAGDLDPPTVTFQDPGIRSMPTVTDPPAVVSGVVQE